MLHDINVIFLRCWNLTFNRFFSKLNEFLCILRYEKIVLIIIAISLLLVPTTKSTGLEETWLGWIGHSSCLACAYNAASFAMYEKWLVYVQVLTRLLDVYLLFNLVMEKLERDPFVLLTMLWHNIYLSYLDIQVDCLVGVHTHDFN